MVNSSNEKILHVCKVYLPVRGGVQKVVQSITSLTGGYQHCVVTSGEDGAIAEQTLSRVNVIRARSYLNIASMPIAPSIIKEIRSKAKTSAAICVHYPFPLADLALASITKLPPLIVYWHSNIVAQKKLKWLSYPLIILTLKRASTIVVTSQRMIDNSTLLTKFRHKVKVIPYGLPPASIDINSAPRTNDPYFLLIGRHVSYKGIDVALKALSKVDTRLIIAGNGPLFEQHKLLAQDLGVDHKVLFMKDSPDDELEHLIDASIGLILPSIMHNEAFALVQLEAMRLAKPVINTSLTSTVPTIARHNIEGLTIEPKNPEALATAMNTLANDANLAIKLGNNGFKRFNQHYTADKFGVALNALFAELVKR